MMVAYPTCYKTMIRDNQCKHAVSPVEVSQTKELSGLLLTNCVIGFCQCVEVAAESIIHHVILTAADSLSTEHQLINIRVSTSHHYPTIHLGWIQCPVGDSNKCHSLFPCNHLCNNMYVHNKYTCFVLFLNHNGDNNLYQQ